MGRAVRWYHQDVLGPEQTRTLESDHHLALEQDPLPALVLLPESERGVFLVDLVEQVLMLLAQSVAKPCSVLSAYLDFPMSWLRPVVLLVSPLDAAKLCRT